MKHLRDHRGRLLRTWRAGHAKLNGYLDDYAFFIAGLLTLSEADGDIRWFDAAVKLQDLQDTHHADAQGGYFTTSNDHETLLAREKPSYDGAEPAGNSVAAMNLLRLFNFTSRESYRRKADGCFKAFAADLQRGSTAQPAMLSALDMRLDTALQVVLVRPANGDFGHLATTLAQQFLPNRAIAQVSVVDATQQAHRVPILENKRPKAGQATAYVCEEGRCEQPTSDPKTLAKQLLKMRPLYRDRTPPQLPQPGNRP